MQVHVQLVDLSTTGETKSRDWESITHEFTEDVNSHILKLQNFSSLVESKKITADVTKEIKESFINASSKNTISAQLEPLREFLCEAFCLIDIIEELMINSSPE